MVNFMKVSQSCVN